jgi:hypothetical protein
MAINISDPLRSNYDLSGITNISIMDDPAGFLINFQNVSGIPWVGTLLIGIGIVLFFVMRNNVSSDSEAMAYSGLITSIAGIFLFLIKNSAGTPLVGWGFIFPIILITAVSVFMNLTARNY